MKKSISLLLFVTIALSVFSGCAEPHESTSPPSLSPSSSEQPYTSESSEVSVDILKLTELFLQESKGIWGLNVDEPEPTATFIGNIMVDNETWYNFSYNVSFLSERKQSFIVTEDLRRIYQKKTEDDYSGKAGKDVWVCIRDPLREITTGSATRSDSLNHDFLLKAVKDFGVEAGHTGLTLAVVQGRTCLIGELSTNKDMEYIPLASYAMTIDGKDFYRMTDDGVYYLVTE